MLSLVILLCGYHPSINNNIFFFSLYTQSFSNPLDFIPKINLAFVLCFPVLSCSVVSNSLQPHGLYSLPGSSIHGIIQARILERVAMPSCRGSSQPRDQTLVSHIAGGFFTIWATREAFGSVYHASFLFMYLFKVPGSKLGSRLALLFMRS